MSKEAVDELGKAFKKEQISMGSYQQEILGAEIVKRAGAFGPVRPLNIGEITNHPFKLQSIAAGDFSMGSWCITATQEGGLVLFQGGLDKLDMVRLEDFFRQDPEFLQAQLRRYCEVAVLKELQYTLNLRKAIHDIEPEVIIPATIVQMVQADPPETLAAHLESEAARIRTFSRLLAANTRFRGNITGFLHKLKNAAIRLDDEIIIDLDTYLEHIKICPGEDPNKRLYVNSLKSARDQLIANLQWAISPENRDPLPAETALSTKLQDTLKGVLAKTHYSMRELIRIVFSAQANGMIDLNSPVHCSFLNALFPIIDRPDFWDKLNNDFRGVQI